MIYIEDFYVTGESFEERTGDPDAFSAAVGRIVIYFAELRDQVSKAIHLMLRQNENVGEAITCQMPFADQVQLMASLVRSLQERQPFNVGTWDADVLLAELVERCLRAEELRNQVLRSSWIGCFLAEGKAVLRQTTANPGHDLRVQEQEADAGYLLDVADFFCSMALHVEQFFLGWPSCSDAQEVDPMDADPTLH